MTDESQTPPFTYGIPPEDFEALHYQISNIVLAGHEFRMGYRTEDDMRQHEGVLMAMIGNLLRAKDAEIEQLKSER